MTNLERPMSYNLLLKSARDVPLPVGFMREMTKILLPHLFLLK